MGRGRNEPARSSWAGSDPRITEAGIDLRDGIQPVPGAHLVPRALSAKPFLTFLAAFQRPITGGEEEGGEIEISRTGDLVGSQVEGGTAQKSNWCRF